MFTLRLKEQTGLATKPRQLAALIKAAVFAGQLKAEERLPSVRDAATHWKVSKDAVHRAYALLRKEGVIVDTDDRGRLPRYMVSAHAHRARDKERADRLAGVVAGMVAQAKRLGFTLAEIEQATSDVLAKMTAQKTRSK